MATENHLLAGITQQTGILNARLLMPDVRPGTHA